MHICRNNQYPARGRKQKSQLLQSPLFETINTPLGDGNIHARALVPLFFKKQSTPRQGTEMPGIFGSLPFLLETINAPSGDGNMRGISFRHCTMKKLLPR